MTTTPRNSDNGTGDSQNPNASLVCFRRFPRREPANILAAILCENEVEASVFGDDAAIPFIGNAQGYRVMIDATARERASEIEEESREALAAAMAEPGQPPLPWEIPPPLPNTETDQDKDREAPPGTLNPERYKTFWHRLAATTLDHLFFVPLTAVGFYTFIPLGQEPRTGTVLVFAVITFLAWYMYRIAMHVKYGQTLGKMAVGVKVVSISEPRLLTVKEAFLRESVPIVLYCAMLSGDPSLVTRMATHVLHSAAPDILTDVMLVWMVLEVLATLLSERRRAVHDVMAKSVVIKEEGKRNEE